MPYIVYAGKKPALGYPAYRTRKAAGKALGMYRCLFTVKHVDGRKATTTKEGK